MCIPLRSAAVAILAGVLLPSVASACLWDHDTIQMERARFPSTLELITGKFLRHSPEFYQWRIENRLKRLESDPTNVALLDDLAVAYDKTGQHDKAIETAMRTEQLHPGRYETAANLATFYFHAGRLEEGLPHIDRALAINPDAHFGREKYQKLLVEYVLHQRKGGPQKLPLAEVKVFRNPPEFGDIVVEDTFANYLGRKDGSGQLPSPKESAAAIKGILGMMKFGKHDSPVLLEALGTLLTPMFGDDAKLLAARAYLKASYDAPEGPARTVYRWLAEHALLRQTPGPGREEQISLEQVEADFQKELAEANAWYAKLRERELSWIREGKDPEAEFDKFYDREPELSDPEANRKLAIYLITGAAALLVLAVAGLVVFVYVRRRRARQRAGADTPRLAQEPETI
jgi:tetratricopeptide (TPR) repeat protein